MTTRSESGKKGVLFLVGVHIGNPGDISRRAVEVLMTSDILACEEPRQGRRILRACGIDRPLISVNEHTEKEASEELLEALSKGRTVALIPDCGMPVIADPGAVLLRKAVDRGIRISAVPGPSSVTAALALSGFDVARFLYYGFLSPNNQRRRIELRDLRTFRFVMVFLEAPYRLRRLSEDLRDVLGAHRGAFAACDMTTPEELLLRGTLDDIARFFESDRARRECVFVVKGANAGRRSGGLSGGKKKAERNPP